MNMPAQHSSLKWYQKKLRRLLVDMHIPDWNEEFLKDFSAEKYVENMIKANISCAEVYAGNCLGLCLFPSEKGFVHKSLKNRDLVGEIVEECKKKGLEVQLYFNVYHRSAFEAHPSWRILAGEERKNTRELGMGHGRFGLCCVNSPFGEFFLEVIKELANRYETKGYWIDMLGWWSMICHCDSCQKRYREEWGKEIPQIIDWNDPDFTLFIQWRAKVLAEYAQKITDTVKAKYPERTVTIQSASVAGGWNGGMSHEFVKASEFLAGDFTGNHIEQSVICKLFSAISPNKPMEFMTPRCETLSHHTTERSFENILMRAYAALANQSSFTLIDAIDPAGTLDERFYEKAGRINAAYAEYEKYILPDSVPVSDCAIYYEFDSINTDEVGPLAEKDMKKACTLQQPIRKELVAKFNMAHRFFTFTGVFDQELSRHKVIILSDAARISDRECERLRKYVADGGKLYASCCSTLFDKEKGIRKDFALADVFGVHYKGKTPRVTYIAPSENSFLNEFITVKYPVMLDSPQVILEADADTEVLGQLVLPVSHPDEQTFFGSAISNPPMVHKGTPALTRHKYGKGEVLYCAGRLEEVPYHFHKKIFEALLQELMKEPLLKTNAHENVECTLYEQEKEKRYILSLLNQIPDPANAPFSNIEISLKFPSERKIKSIRLAPEEKEIAFKVQKDGRLSFTVPLLEYFAMYTVQYE